MSEISVGDAAATRAAHVDTPKVYEPLLAGDGRAYFGWLGLLAGLGLALRALLLVIGPINAPDRARIDPAPVTNQLAANLMADRAFGWTPIAPGDKQAQSTAAAKVDNASAGLMDRSRILHLQHQANAHSSETQPAQGRAYIAETFEMPGYPAFVALGRTAGLSNPTLAALQCLISVGLGIGVFAIGYRLMRKPGAALLAAAVVLLHPSMILAPLALTDDVVFAALIVLGLWAATRRTGRMAVVAGIALALAGLVRPISLLIGPAIGLWMIAFDRRTAVMISAAVVALVSLIGPGAWMVRNSIMASDSGVGFGTSTQPMAGDARRAAAIDVMATGGAMPYQLPQALDRRYQQAVMGQTTADEPSRITYQSAKQPRSAWTAKSDQTQASHATGAPAPVPIDRLEHAADKTMSNHRGMLGRLFSRNMLGLFTADAMPRLYRVMGLGRMPPTAAHGLATGRIVLAPRGETDFGAEALAWGWLGLGLVMLAGSGLGLGLMVVRRQWQTMVLVAGGMAYLAWAVPNFSAGRLQVVAVIFQALLIAAIFARNRRPFALAKPRAKKTRKQRRDDLIFEAQDDDDSAPIREPSHCLGRPL